MSNQENIPNQSKKQLRIAFAMGGGVSLGTFSGAALTEALKTLMISAYTGKIDYDDVVIDVFSGASAGAIALGIMLRMMISSEDKILYLRELDQYKNCKDGDEIKQLIWSNLIIEYEGLKNIQDKSKKDKIIACQIAQNFQELIWVEKVDIVGLGNLNDKYDTLLDEGSLLSSDFLEKIAVDLIYPKDSTNFAFNKNTPINDRVLFSCTLTRLFPETFNSYNEFKSDFFNPESQKFLQKLLPIVAKDGASSKNHKDHRIFDIDLRELSEIEKDKIRKPERWVEIYKDVRHDMLNPSFVINNLDTWRMITQTTLACGAFPFAFEPKVLKRKYHELSEETRSNIENKSDQRFSYIDGGVLNNEPISEAFRLSSYMDGTYENENFDRVVIFVDPSINHEKPSKINTFYKNYQVSEENGKTERKTGLQKIIGQFSPLLSVIRNQSTISEIDKASATLDKFNNREQLRKFYFETVKLGFEQNWNSVINKDSVKEKLNEAVSKIKNSIGQLHNRISIPTNFPLVSTELKKMLRNDQNHEIFSNKFHNQFGNLNNMDNSFDKVLSPENFVREFPEMIQDYVIFLYFLMIDATLDLIGKNDNYALIPIGPVVMNDNSPEPIELLGQPFAGFLGFFHRKIRKIDFEMGRKSSYEILCRLNVIGECRLPSSKNPDELFDFEIKEIKDKVDRFTSKRIFNELLKNNFLRILDFSGDRWSVKDSFAKLVLNIGAGSTLEQLSNSLNIDQEKSKNIEIRIKVNSRDIQANYFRDKLILGNKDLFPTAIGDHLYIILNGEYLYRSYATNRFEWTDSSYIKNNSIQLDKDGVLKDKKLLSIPLPTDIIEKVNSKLYPILLFDLSDYPLEEINDIEDFEKIEEKLKENWVIIEGRDNDD